MKRKIAAILAADVAGYSRLVAEDEEEAIRRLAAYRGVFDDFIANHDGRIFNTAGDAVLAEFASSVEAVRCAIEVQESLRSRNLAFPPSRQMAFRVGITIADVVERDGDLLGDGVNIAARLQGLAEPGGICVSRAVYEQVANKLTVAFMDIGQQSVKNIPEPVHAFVIAASPDAAVSAARRHPPAGPTAKRSATSMATFALSAIAAVAATGALAWVMLHPATPQPPTGPAPPQNVAAAPPPSPPPAAAAEPRADPPEPKSTVPTVPASGAPVTGAPPAVPPASVVPAATPAAGTTSPADARSSSGEPAAGGLIRNPAIEKPFDIRALPIVPLDLHASVRSALAAATGRKALAVAANGRFAVGSSALSADDAVRQALEGCARHGGTCRVLAVDDVFVVPIPRTVFVRGLFDPRTAEQIPAGERPELARRLEAASGWSAVAVGTGGRPGVGHGAASEADAIRSAIADCSTRDSNCRVIALGPFRVERY